jgi:hypothetical protein
MKKIMTLILALIVVTSVAAFAQGDMSGMAPDKATANAPLKTIKGTVKQDGDKITFVADKDTKSWDVVNPETLKDHVGHHVEVSAHVYADKGSIHIMNVKMLKSKSM